MYDPKRGYPTAVPYVLYRDPAAASRWVAEVTGFTGQPLYGPLPEGELRRNSLDIALAKVSTYGEEVVDVFYVRDFNGQKVTDPVYAEEIARSIRFRLT